MTLATHAITGAAVASLTPQQPILGFVAGFASHYLIDAIPHWDYPILSDSIHPQKGNIRMRFDRVFFRDARNFTLDAALGIIVALLVFAYPPTGLATLTIMAGAIGGILPDPLQFVAKKLPHEPFSSLQRFHQWIHTGWHMRETGYHWLGIISQLAFVVLVVGVATII